MLFVNDIKHV